MTSIIERIKKGKFWQFHGGIHPPSQKQLTSDKPIATVNLPEQLIIPIRQHIGQAGNIIVNVGDSVLKGQALTTGDGLMQVPVHAPTSGKICDIKPALIPHPSGLSEYCIFLTPDGEDKWKNRTICLNYKQLSKDQIRNKIANAGIVGMGGAGFPTSLKVNSKEKINYLIINAAECEPYITADDLLIKEHSASILDGIHILTQLLDVKHVLIGIEDNKPKAIAILKKISTEYEHIHVCVIPTVYPSGGEKQLIKILTGQEVPSGVLPSTLGIVMHNIATCFAIADAVINDTPLIKRVITVTGNALKKPQNVWVLLGTPVSALIKRFGYANTDNKHLIMGGPMMGYSLVNDQIPVIKSSNCLLAPSEKEITSPYFTGEKEVECIRCGQCADVCPANLLPQELQWSAKAKDHTQLQVLNLFDCIECGACAYVCPSQIPLVNYYRIAKGEIREQHQADKKAEKAKIRFEARMKRLEREKLARQEKHKKAAEARKARMNANTVEAKSEKSAVAAALARVKAKKLAEKKAQEKTVAVETKTVQAIEPDDTTKTKTKNTETDAQVTFETDKKARIAAAVAKAKAKKRAEQVKNNQDSK